MKFSIPTENSPHLNEREFVDEGLGQETSVAEVSIAWLKPHPCQNDFFSSSEQELQELALDLQRRGQQEPIHCCPDGTILRGHQRTRAAELVGWTSIKAIVRHEMPDPTSSDAIEELVLDNVMRRQLDDLELARCYGYLKESSRAQNDEEAGDLRDRLAVRLACGKSGRSLDRLERLLELPRSVQDLISNRRIRKSHAEKILQLSSSAQTQFYSQLEQGGDLETLLREFKIVKTSERRSVTERFERILQAFHSDLAGFEQQPEALTHVQIRGGDVIELMERAAVFLADCARRKRNLQAQDSLAITAQLNCVKRLDKLSGLKQR